MSDLVVVKMFVEGGWIMWPMLITSIVALTVISERFLWWRAETRKRDAIKRAQLFAALEKHDIEAASSLAGSSQDSVLRVLWYGINHRNTSLQGAVQLCASIELARAGRFIVILDTIVTLAPLLGLLGTVTGLMRAFFKSGNTELSGQAIGGGIAEALIATACGLTVAVVALIFLNYFSLKLSRFQFELQKACGTFEMLLGTSAPGPIAPEPPLSTP
jgi:biopolymer transport protein ExbB